MSTEPQTETNLLPVDKLAQLIRRVDGNHTLGAGALAQAIVDEGWVEEDHVEYGADHKYSDLDFANEDGELFTDKDEFLETYSDYTNVTLLQRSVGPWTEVEA